MSPERVVAKGKVGELFSASFRMLLIVLSVIVSSTAQVSAVLTLLSLTDDSSLSAVDAPSLIVPLDLNYTVTSSIDAQEPSCVPDILKCAWICEQDSNCTSYNYNQALRRCEFYYYRSLNYAVNTTCAHYRVNSDFSYLSCLSTCQQWRAEGGANGATAPGIHLGGIQGTSFRTKCR